MRNEGNDHVRLPHYDAWGTIVSPSIAQMSPNFAQVCTITCQMVLVPFTSKLVRILKKLHEKTQI